MIVCTVRHSSVFGDDVRVLSIRQSVFWVALLVRNGAKNIQTHFEWVDAPSQLEFPF